MFGNSEKKSTRFLMLTEESVKGGTTRLFVDTETGVQYLFIYALEAGGLTILADEKGQPLLNEEYKRKM